MRSQTFALIFSVLVLFSGAHVVLAAQEGSLTLKQGSVKIVRGEQSEILRRTGQQVSLSTGDWVQTGVKSKAEVSINGKEETIELSSKSFFKMEDVSQETTHVVMLSGKGRFNVAPSKKKLKRRNARRFQLRTVTALVGVRGTEFVVGASEQQTSLLTLSGIVSMASVELPDIEVEVPKDQASGVKKGETPTAPVKVPPALRKQIIQSDSPAAFASVSFGATVDPKNDKKPAEKAKEKKEKNTGKTLKTGKLEDVQNSTEKLQKIVEDVERVQSEVEKVQEDVEQAKQTAADSTLLLDIQFE